jgi:GT2 family glycosyltransferase
MTRRIDRAQRRLRHLDLIVAAEQATAAADWPLAVNRWRAVAAAGGRSRRLLAAAPTSTALRVQGHVDAAAATIAAAERLRGARRSIPLTFERAAIELMRRDADAALPAVERLRRLLPPGHELERSALVMHAAALRMAGLSARSVYRPEELHARQLAQLTPEHLRQPLPRSPGQDLRPSAAHDGEVRAPLVTLTLLVDGDVTSTMLERTRASIAAQTDTRHEVIESTVAGLGDTLAGAGGALVLLLEPGDTVRSDLVELLAQVQAAAEHDVIIADETHPSTNDGSTDGQRVPLLKPAFDPELLRCQPAYGRMVAVRRDLFLRAHEDLVASGGRDGTSALLLVWAALLRAAERGALVTHLPVVALEAARPFPLGAAGQGAALVKHHLQRISGGVAAASVVAPTEPQHPLRIRWTSSDPDLTVSVVIPTRDRAELLERCVDAVLTDGRRWRLEVIIVDNGSLEPATRDLLQRLDRTQAVHVIASPGPFNFSLLINRGVAAATGAVLIILNNDVVTEHPGWIDELVTQVSRSEVGIVGALLTYEDGSVQHAGIITGINGFVDHGLRGWPADHAGPQGLLRSSRRVAAVTAACMALRRDVFDELGGFDEEHLPVEFSDVDLCLRAWGSGRSVIWTPHARLQHVEGATRSRRWTEADATAETRQRIVFRERWGAALGSDPAYHPV